MASNFTKTAKYENHYANQLIKEPDEEATVLGEIFTFADFLVNVTEC